MAMIQYKCENCGVKLESPDELGDGEDRCPSCGTVCHVPLSKAQKTAKAQQDQAKKQAAAKARYAAETRKAAVSWSQPKSDAAAWWNDAQKRHDNPQHETMTPKERAAAVRQHKKKSPDAAYPGASNISMGLAVTGWIVIFLAVVSAIAVGDKGGATAIVITLFMGIIGGLVLMGLGSAVGLLTRIAWKLEYGGGSDPTH